MKIRTFALLAPFALGCSLSQAASFQNDTGLASPTSTETFDGAVYANGTAAAGLFSGFNFGSGLTVSSNYSGVYGLLSGQSITNLANGVTCPCTNPASIDFSSAVSGAAFSFVSYLQNTTFSAYLGGSLVESAVFSTNSSGKYVGFTGIQFDRITISLAGASSGAANNGGFGLDNLQITAVPEPSSFAMLFAGLGLMGVMARRRMKA